MSTPLSEQANYFVYRIIFEDGSEYIGITGVGIQNRLKKHQQTQNKVGILIRAGVKWECVCVASGLTRREALDREHAEVLKLDKPLNARYQKTYTPKICQVVFDKRGLFIHKRPVG